VWWTLVSNTVDAVCEALRQRVQPPPAVRRHQGRSKIVPNAQNVPPGRRVIWLVISLPLLSFNADVGRPWISAVGTVSFHCLNGVILALHQRRLAPRSTVTRATDAFSTCMFAIRKDSLECFPTVRSKPASGWEFLAICCCKLDGRAAS